MRSSMPRIPRCSAAAASTAQSIAPPARNSSPNAACSGGCPPGEARLTRGYRLPAGHVIHTVGPIWRGGEPANAEILARCYRSCLAIAREQAISRRSPSRRSRPGSTAFPAKRQRRSPWPTVGAHLAENEYPETRHIRLLRRGKPSRLYRTPRSGGLGNYRCRLEALVVELAVARSRSASCVLPLGSWCGRRRPGLPRRGARPRRASWPSGSG